ncbi:glucose-1-phosphate adenylyltransferase large subunit 1-like [Pyrus ussuriensis x Pyrus communis]|uniref:Glucose-1-phosphate adenylyltransferase large subunit 1-like n=1 Tax=Pyrus ussuriensis x Pyrus communis TaxID=2448454 RepID=A0A5N5I4E5_9ROSA|nr:glucose-1-phosphate adenylyltransferase large subunit 1-like [Pyrus ussuriensis x Pyrus communis]
MSNCINSNINKIFVLTQFNSASLNRHIARTYFGNGINFGDRFVEVLAATQTQGEAGMNWFQGTADAVRQFTWVFEDAKNRDVENIVILSGDHLYRMDYMDFVQQADTTLLGLSPQDALKAPYVASMGVYVFKTEILLNLLRWRYPTSNDFGSEIIPAAVRERKVQAYMFRDYWEDIGTIKSFYDANLALTEEFYDPKTPIFTSPRFLPQQRLKSAGYANRLRLIVDAIISHGCFLQECSVQHSIVGERSRLNYGVELKDAIMMGADNYQTESEIASLLADGEVPIGIGSNTKIRNCIIDKNAKIGKDVMIVNKDGVQEADRPEDGFYIREGITIILEKATIEDGMII